MLKSTPGPWHVVRYGDGDSLVICLDEEGNHRVAFMATPGCRDQQERRKVWKGIKANARLIALAPEMADALREVIPVNICTTNPNVPDDMDVHLTFSMGELRRIRAILAKIDGAA